MPWIDLEKLLEPISAEDPAGPSLEYDPAFLSLEQAARGKEERRMGSAVLPAEPVDHGQVFEQALALLARSKDLRVATFLLRSLIDRAGFGGLSEGLALIRALLERYWAHVHPRLEASDGNDPIMRASAISTVGGPGVLSALRSAPLLQSKSMGPLGLRELAVILEHARETPPGAMSLAAVEAAFQEQQIGTLESLGRVLGTCLEHLSGMEAAFQAGTGTNAEWVKPDTADPRWPDLSELVRLLQQAQNAVGFGLELGTGGRGRDALEGTPPGPAATGKAPGMALGALQSREDVLRVLDQICSYYERNEPTSPLPLLLQRCKRLVSMNFVEIIRDIAPDALSQVEQVTGKTEQ